MGSDRVWDKRDESAELVAERAKVADLELQRDGLQAFRNRVVATLGLSADAAEGTVTSTIGLHMSVAKQVDQLAERRLQEINSIAAMLGAQCGAAPDAEEIQGRILVLQKQANTIPSHYANALMSVAELLGVPWADGNAMGQRITDAIIALMERVVVFGDERLLDERQRIIRALDLAVPDGASQPSIDGIISTIARNKQVVESACKERDLARAAEASSLRAVAEALGPGQAAHLPLIIDRITRLREQHAAATSEHSSALAAERRAHEETKKQLGSLMGELADILEPAIKPADRQHISVTRTVRALVAEVLTLRDRVSEQREIIDDDEHGIVYCSRCEKPYCDAQMCPALTSETCFRCPDCHEDAGCDDGVDTLSDPEDEDDSDASRALVADLARVLDAVCSAMATDPRDWSVDKTDAWLYGILVGWGVDGLREAGRRLGWSYSAINRIAELHDIVARATLTGDDDE